MNLTRSKLMTLSERQFERSRLMLVEQPDQPEQEEPAPQQPNDQSDSSESSPITVQPASEVSDEFNQKLQTAIASIPEVIWRILSDEGYSIVPAKTLSEVMTDSQSGVDWGKVSSVVSGDNKQIIIAESTLDSTGNETPNLNTEGLLRHSVGHVVDTLAPKYVTEHFHDKFSDLEKFKYAHTSDMTRLSKDKQGKLAYYTAEGDVSRSECFAECFAALHGGGAVYTIDVMSKYFPAVMKQVKELVVYVEKNQKLTVPDQGDDQDSDDQEPEGQEPEQAPV